MGRRIKHDLDIVSYANKFFATNGTLLTVNDVALLVAERHLALERSAFKIAGDLIEREVKAGNLIPETPRKCPQRYWPKSALSNFRPAIDVNLERAKLKELLGRADGIPRYIHKLQLKTKMQEDHWKYRRHSFRHEGANGQYWDDMTTYACNMPYKIGISPTGTFQIFSKISLQPFKLENDEDIDRIISSLSELRGWWIARGFYGLPEARDWILQRCDINKDIPLRGKEAMGENFNLTFKDVVSEFRIYTKAMNECKYLRIEQSKDFATPTTIEEALHKARTEPIMPSFLSATAEHFG